MPPKRAKKRSRDDEEDEGDVENRSTSSTACFNVGGTPYQVSRSLLEQHPDTMLTRMASKTWQSNPEKPLFVERDGERFRYVLDYMRDGKVHLPGGQGGVTKASLLEELTYFGFVDVDPDNIAVEFAHVDVPKYIARLTTEFEEEKQRLAQQREQISVNIASITVAHACSIRRMSDGTASLDFCVAEEDTSSYSSTLVLLPLKPGSLDSQVVDAVKNTSLVEHRESLDRAMSKYGLKISNYKEHQGRFPGQGGQPLFYAVCRVTLDVSAC